MTNVQRARGKLEINRNNTVSVTGKANAMANGLEAHPALFGTSTPSPSALRDQVGVVNKAETVAGTRAKGTAAARNVERAKLVGMLEIGRAYIQDCADKSASYLEATSTIQAGGLTVAISPKHTKAILAAKQGPLPGSVKLAANAALLTNGSRKKSFFNWQLTVDGKTFVDLPSTPKAKTSVANLTPLTTVGFRVCITNASGIAEAWSQVVSIIVH